MKFESFINFVNHNILIISFYFSKLNGLQDNKKDKLDARTVQFQDLLRCLTKTANWQDCHLQKATESENEF